MSNSTDTKHLGNKVDRDKPYVVGNKKPSANRRDPADLRLTPMLLGDQEDVEGRPLRAPHVGQQGVEGIKRSRGEGSPRPRRRAPRAGCAH
jgi:hypothetical protein